MWKYWQKLLVLIETNEQRKVTITEPWWYPGVAIITGLLAAVAGVLAVRGAYLGNEAVRWSNIAILSQNQASDAWAEYEADSMKAHQAHDDGLLAPNPAVKAQFQKEYDDLRARQPALKEKALGFEKERDRNSALATKQVKSRDGMTLAGVIIQLAIGLASVAAMTKRTNAFIASLVVTLAGLVMTGMAFVEQFFH